jgi:hypothetical protein
MKRHNISTKVVVIGNDNKIRYLKVPYYHQATLYQYDLYLLANTQIGEKIVIGSDLYERREDGLCPVRVPSKRSFKNRRA